MEDFSQKQLAQPIRVGLKLQQARKLADISLSFISEQTKISRKHLQALEQCQFDDLPFAETYVRHFIKAYCKAIGEDPAPYLVQFQQEEVQDVPQTHQGPIKPTRPTLLYYLPVIFRVGAACLVAGVFLTYLGVQIKHILEPPDLTIYTPEDGFVTKNNTIIIQGKTEAEAEVSINGTRIKHNEEGAFKEAIDISSGVNTIVITAKKKHGQTRSDTRHVIVRESDQLTRR